LQARKTVPYTMREGIAKKLEDGKNGNGRHKKELEEKAL
jgi:hypothetical protein